MDPKAMRIWPACDLHVTYTKHVCCKENTCYASYHRKVCGTYATCSPQIFITTHNFLGHIWPKPVYVYNIQFLHCGIASRILSLCLLDGVMDTKAEAASRVTFIPSLLTFEEEMLQKFGNQPSPSDPETTTTWYNILCCSRDCIINSIHRGVNSWGRTGDWSHNYFHTANLVAEKHDCVFPVLGYHMSRITLTRLILVCVW